MLFVIDILSNPLLLLSIYNTLFLCFYTSRQLYPTMKNTLIVTLILVVTLYFWHHQSNKTVPTTSATPAPTVSPQSVANPLQGIAAIEQTLTLLNASLDLLEQEASTDTLLMKFIREYRKQQLSAVDFDASFKKLRGMPIDIIPMAHMAYGINEEDSLYVSLLQHNIANIVRNKYTLFWTEDFCGGKVVTKDNAWEEVRTELENTTIPTTMHDLSKASIDAYLEKIRHFSAAQQIIHEPGITTVMGGDYRPLKNIHQRLLEYAAHADRGTLPSTLDPGRMPILRAALSKGRDLYLLRYIAEHGSNEPQVAVFGAAHTEHLGELLSLYEAGGQLLVIQE